MKFINIDKAREGMVLVKPIFDNNGNLMLNSNTELSEYYLKRIKQMGLEKIYIYENYEEEKENLFYKEVISEELRMKAVRNLKALNIDAVTYYANEIVNELTSQADILIDLADIRGYHEYTYQHSVNVAITSVACGVGLGLNNEQLQKLSAGAILHDIGKLVIDPEIINKPGKLTDEEFEEVRKHPMNGYNMLKNNEHVSSLSRAAVLMHHENEDGTGYPLKKGGDELHLFAKIVHVADVFDALVSERPYKKAYTPSEAMEYLMGGCGSLFNEEVVRSFMKYIALYPLGQVVLLSNGERAVVKKNFPDNALRPIVYTEDGREINLRDDFDALNITITKLLD